MQTGQMAKGVLENNVGEAGAAGLKESNTAVYASFVCFDKY